MSDQDGTQASTKRRRSRQTSKQNGSQVPALQRPPNDDTEAWEAYWEKQGQAWRTEPEIDTERQQYLEKHLSTIPDEREGNEEILYCKDMQLNRADIEWLLATHKKMDKVVIFTRGNELRQRHESLTLSGADLRNENLSGLPLERVNLLGARLEGARLRGTHLEESVLIRAHLEGADLTGIHLEEAHLGETHLEGVPIFKAHLEGVFLNNAHLEKANLYMTHLERAYLVEAHLEGADLRVTHQEGARLMNAHLEGADLEYAHLEGANLLEANLAGAHCCRTFFDAETGLNGITISDKDHGSASLAEVSWGNANLTVVDWSQVKLLGDESIAQKSHDKEGKEKDRKTQIAEYQTAIRANRQLAVALRDQGLNDEADHFAYRAQRNKRDLLKRQVQYGLEQIPILHFLVYRPNKQLNWIKLLLLPILIISILFSLYYLKAYINAYIDYQIYPYEPDFYQKYYAYNNLVQMITIAFLSMFLYFALFRMMFRLFIIFFILLIIYLSPLYLLFLLVISAFQNILVLFGVTFIVALIFILFFVLNLFNVILPLIPIICKLLIKIPIIKEDKYNKSFPISKIYNTLNILTNVDYQRKITKLQRANPVKWRESFIRDIYPKIKPFTLVQISYSRYVFSMFLDLLAGYGFKPVRSVIVYLLTIVIFASLYYAIGQAMLEQLTPLGSLVLSLTSFHGRGFFPGLNNSSNPNGIIYTLDNPLIVLAAVEAVIGLIIEISFIATFTQRFFGK
jgi:uncharacterized protein YjbI with pentapeptide repeats